MGLVVGNSGVRMAGLVAGRRRRFSRRLFERASWRSVRADGELLEDDEESFEEDEDDPFSSATSSPIG
jgi:hypothetical protein